MSSDKTNTFSTAVGTGLASYISKKYNLDNPTYMAVTTLVTLSMSFILISSNSLLSYVLTEGLHCNKYIIYALICLILPIILFLLRHVLSQLFDMLLFRKYHNINLRGKFMIKKFTDYMSQHTPYYTCYNELIIEDTLLAYDKITHYVYFNDTEYCVKGRIFFYHYVKKEQIVIEPVDTKKSDEKKDETKTTQQKIINSSPDDDKFKNGECTEIRIDKCILYSKKCTNMINYIDCIMKCPNNNEHNLNIIGNEFITFKKYINSNKHYFTSYSSDIGANQNTVDIFFACDTIIYFNDTVFNVSGFIKWTANNGGTIFLINCNMHSNYSLRSYLKDVALWIANNNELGGNIIQYEVNKTYNKDVIKIMYDGPVKSIHELETMYINTLFHHDINMLWEHIKTINYFPDKIKKMGQSPRLNLLLHGPPGTGKSTFAYRIAMATKRHIICVRLSKYTKDELIELFSNPKLKNGCHCSPKDAIFVLDEFDLDLDKLLLNQKRKEDQYDLSKKFMTDILRKTTQDKQPQIITNTNQQITIDNPKSAVQNATEGLTQIGTIMDDVGKMYDKLNTLATDTVSLSDLLTIFQGAVPIDGCIIIAMTNKYDSMKENCPQLFRAGRLTPIKFGHFDRTIMNQISQYYFKRDLDIQITQDLQPSTVTDIALTASLLPRETQYDYFVSKIKTILV